MHEEAVVRLAGPITGATARATQEQILASLPEKCHRLTLDLADVTAVDGAGLGVFVLAFKELRKTGGDVNLANASEAVRDVFEYTHQEKLFLFDGVPAAERRQRDEPVAGAPQFPAAAPAARQTGSLRPFAAAGAASTTHRERLLYVGLVVSLAMFGATQFYFQQRFGEDDLAPYLRSNAAMVRAILRDQYRSARRYPASPGEVQLLLAKRGVHLSNVYSKGPMQVLADVKRAAPGDMLYELASGTFRLRVVGRDGKTIRDGEGRELVLS